MTHLHPQKGINIKKNNQSSVAAVSSSHSVLSIACLASHICVMSIGRFLSEHRRIRVCVHRTQ